MRSSQCGLLSMCGRTFLWRACTRWRILRLGRGRQKTGPNGQRGGRLPTGSHYSAASARLLAISSQSRLANPKMGGDVDRTIVVLIDSLARVGYACALPAMWRVGANTYAGIGSQTLPPRVRTPRRAGRYNCGRLASPAALAGGRAQANALARQAAADGDGTLP